MNFWAERYLAKGDTFLRERAPYTSKDIDFCGVREDVRECARRIGGKALLPDEEYFDATNAGKVIFTDSSGHEREIDFITDFITHPFGLDLEGTTQTAIPVTALQGRVSFLVMHAERCMESRVHNFVGLPGYFNAHAAKQVAVAISCAKRFLEEILANRATEPRAVRSVLKLNERIFDFCQQPHALELYGKVSLSGSGRWQVSTLPSWTRSALCFARPGCPMPFRREDSLR